MNYYSEAIRIITEKKFSAEIMLAEIAKKNPKALCDAEKRLLSEDWSDEIKNIIKEKGKIPAIKRLREITGMSLRDSKNALDSIA